MHEAAVDTETSRPPHSRAQRPAGPQSFPKRLVVNFSFLIFSLLIYLIFWNWVQTQDLELCPSPSCGHCETSFPTPWAG